MECDDCKHKGGTDNIQELTSDVGNVIASLLNVCESRPSNSADVTSPTADNVTTGDIGTRQSGKRSLKLKTRERSAQILSEFKNCSIEMTNTTKLDTNVRKITSFINKIRNLNTAGFLKSSNLEEEMTRYNLSKYLSEICAAVASLNLNKAQRVSSLAHLCLLISVRYEGFADQLNLALQSVSREGLHTKSPTQYKNELRLLTELILNGVFSVNGDARRSAKKHLYRSLELVLCSVLEFATFPHAVVMLQYLKQYADEICGFVNRAEATNSPKSVDRTDISQSSDEDCVLSAQKISIIRRNMESLSDEDQVKIKKMFTQYYLKILEKANRAKRDLMRVRAKNMSILHLKGEVFSERKKLEDEYANNLSELRQLCTGYNELLCEEPIDFCDDMDVFADSQGGNEGASMENVDETDGYWDDDEQRTFYRVLPANLVVVNVPEFRRSADAFANRKSTTTTTTFDKLKRTKKKKKSSSFHEDEDIENMYDYILDEEEGPEEGEKAPTDTKGRFDEFFDGLQKQCSIDMIDEQSRYFLSTLNTKSNRTKLVQSMTRLLRTHNAILPHYARLLATISSVYKDFKTQLSNSLTRQIKFHMRRKDQGCVDLKIRRLRLIGELVKFDIFSKQDALMLFRLMLNNFVYQNVEMACALLETCGPYLYHCQSSHNRCRAYLEIMIRKAKVSLLSDRFRMLVESAYNTCKAKANGESETGSGVPRCSVEWPSTYQYFNYILTTKLSRASINRISRSMLKLNWDDPGLRRYALEMLSCPDLVCFNQIVHLANVTARLSKHPLLFNLHVAVADLVIENLCAQLSDLPNARLQKLICQARYVGELYNFEMIDYICMLKILYIIICPSYPIEENDPASNLIRIRMVCHILGICATRVEEGSPLRALTQFVYDFQCYVWLKRSLPFWQQRTCRFPHDVIQSISDGIRKVHKKILIARSLNQAIQNRNKYCNIGMGHSQSSLLSQKDSFDSSRTSDDSSTLTDDTICYKDENIKAPRVRYFPKVSIAQETHHQRGTEEDDREADMEILRLLDQHVSEQYQQRSATEGKRRLEIANLSMILPTHTKPQNVWLNRQHQADYPEADGRHYRLLSRQGSGKVHLQTIKTLPVSDELARRIEADRRQACEEREELKRRTLDISEQQLLEEQQEMVRTGGGEVSAGRVHWNHP